MEDPGAPFGESGLQAFRIPPPGAAAPPGRGPQTHETERWVEQALGAAKARMDAHGDDPQRVRIFQILDLLAPLRATVRRRGNGQAVTNAWLKMYEIATHFRLPGQLLGGEGGALRVFCNAELPGAFVSALNHYMAVWHPWARFEWVASSLYPEEGGGALGDDFGLCGGNPARWLMSAEMRGDVTDVGDLEALAARAREGLGGEADLYTADAGIGLHSPDEYAQEEKLTARLHLGQLLAGFLTLRRGGALVAKTYTFVQPYSIALLSLCAGLFARFHVTKPRASRPRNSEVYLVGLGYRGASPEVLADLKRAVAGFDFSNPVLDVDAPELEPPRRAAAAAAEAIHGAQQAALLHSAMELYYEHRDRPERLREQLEPRAAAAQRSWLAANPVPRLPRARALPTARPPRRKGG
jgi:hypothetical protein